MNKTQIIKELTELFHLFKSINDSGKATNVVFPVEEMAYDRPERIYRYFGLEPSFGLDEIIDRFLEQDELTIEAMEQVIDHLSQIAVAHLTKPVMPGTERCHFEEAINEEDGDLSFEDQVAEMRAYVMNNILIPLADEEFTQIELGFRLMWNHSTGKIIGEGDFERWVNQYLMSIEFHIEQRKVDRVIELILEYMEEIGRWE